MERPCLQRTHILVQGIWNKHVKNNIISLRYVKFNTRNVIIVIGRMQIVSALMFVLPKHKKRSRLVKCHQVSASCFFWIELLWGFCFGWFFFFWLRSFDSFYHCNLTLIPYFKDVLKSCAVKQHRDCLVSLVPGGRWELGPRRRN